MVFDYFLTNCLSFFTQTRIGLNNLILDGVSPQEISYNSKHISAKKNYMKSNNSLTLNGNGHHYDIIDELGDNHVATSIDTPLKPDAFVESDESKMERIAHHFRQIMDIIGLDLTDDSLNGTPRRVAKMYVKEIFRGLDPKNKPSIAMFDNKFGYGEMLVEKNISIYSTCEHHFLPIYGFAHIAYISSGKVIGLSKLNRIAQYYAKRPQVQERLTMQIATELKRVLETDDVAIYIDAKHMCVETRGVEDTTSSTVTVEYSGKFKQKEYRDQFLTYIQNNG